MRSMSIWEENLLGVRIDNVLSLVPGLLVATVLAWLSIWLSKFIGVTLLGFEKTPVSDVMLAVLLGLVIGAAKSLPKALRPGFSFAVKKVLRLGIILLGIRLTVFDVFKLGAYGVPIVALCVVSALFLTTCVSRLLSLPERLGVLIAVGTAICGVSAIVATGPAIDAEDEEVTYAVAVITIFGLLATLLYPYLANVIFGGDPLRVGLFLGTSVHDTSQVVGAARVYADVFSSPLALDVATVTKLVRNVSMAVVIPSIAFYYARKARHSESSAKKATPLELLPLFVLGFLVVAVLRSIGDAGIAAGSDAFGMWNRLAWASIHNSITSWAGRLLVVALAGVGLSTNLRTLKGLGVKPFVVGLGAALTAGVVSFVTISLLGSWML